jgi:uncharacterized zinc-type alcohol dehydrogenase-like protein
MKTMAYGNTAPEQPLGLLPIERREVGPDDVAIDILYSGVCHSDVHTAWNEWNNTLYPCVPGHEIVGKVVAVGDNVSRFQAGQVVGVGCMVDSCRTCASCHDGEEQYCTGSGFVGTYNGPDKHLGGHTYGGYSKAIVVNQDFVLTIGHDEQDLPGVAPLLCAGITTYSPLRHWKVGPGQKVGVVGLGGLGHMGVKIAAALGADVTVFTTSPAKRDDALRLGASDVVNSRDAEAMAAQAGTFDFILNTVAAPLDLDPYIAALKRDGTMVLVGVPAEAHKSPSVGNLVFGRRALAGSLIGGIAETQEMLDFCHEHGLTSDIELIAMDAINDAYRRMVKGDVKYRFVIDMASLA